MKTKAQELQQFVESADSAINREDFNDVEEWLILSLRMHEKWKTLPGKL